MGDAPEVKLGHDQAGGEALGFGQDGAVLADEVVPGKDQILGGLAHAGVGVQIAAGQPRRLPGDQLAAVGRLADELVRGRQVDEDGRAGLGQAGRRRRGHPQVLADLAAQHKGGQAAAAEQQVHA